MTASLRASATLALFMPARSAIQASANGIRVRMVCSIEHRMTVQSTHRDYGDTLLFPAFAGIRSSLNTSYELQSTTHISGRDEQQVSARGQQRLRNEYAPSAVRCQRVPGKGPGAVRLRRCTSALRREQ
jgi:hypothetical protein